MLRLRVFSLLLVIISMVLIGWPNGCTKTKISRKFSYTMEDGSRVAISIEYKPQSIGKEKIGIYYYIVQYFPSGKAKAKRLLEASRSDSHYTRYPLRYGVVNISFYDKTGYSLFRNGRYSTLAPGWNHNEDEANQIEGGFEWKGQFGESCITIENFREVDSVKVKYVQH